MKVIIAFENKEFKSEIEYTFKILLDTILGIEYALFSYENLNNVPRNGLFISYGKHKPNFSPETSFIHIYESNLFDWPGYLSKGSLPDPKCVQKVGIDELCLENKECICEDYIPVIYGKKDTKYTENSIVTQVDIIASSFFMLSRYEEVVIKKRDSHKRFMAKDSLAFRINFLDRPIVNEYAEILWGWISSISNGVKRKKREFKVMLTHDIDKIKKYNSWLDCIKYIIRELVLNRSFNGAVETIKEFREVQKKTKKDPFNCFDFLMETDRSLNAEVRYFFMVGGNSKFDYYSIDNLQVKNRISRLSKVGVSIGLHSSYNSYLSEDKLRTEKSKLEEVIRSQITSSRQHFLRLKVPETFRILEKIGILYDFSLGYPAFEGFRAGICDPYPLFDVIERKPLNITEIPLILMDGSLRTYQKLPPDEATKKINKIIEKVYKVKGVMTILWHNTSFDRYRWKGWKQVYLDSLKYISNFLKQA